MNDDVQQDHLSKRVVHLRIPGMEAVRVTRDVAFRTSDAGALLMDIYYPQNMKDVSRAPAVVIVAGYRDAGFEAKIGCKFKDMGSSVSWGQLMAASGIAAITYTNNDPASDVDAVLQHVRHNAAILGIDENRIGVWASSGNVPVALSVLMRDADHHPKCAVLCYALTLDLDGASGVSDASITFGFANPCAGRAVDDLAPDIPMFIARAGKDQVPHLNETLDRFVSGAVACNLPITLVNHPEGPHAFDLFDDSETTRVIVRQILAFMRFHLSA